MYIYGEDTFRSREYLKESKERFKQQRDPQGYNLVVLDGKNTDYSKISAEMKTAPFLAEKRMVVVENILSSSDEKNLEMVLEAIKKNDVPESTVLIFWQGEKHGKSKIVKTLHEELSKQKYSLSHDKLIGPKLVAWLEQKIAKNGAKINRQALNKLSQSGEDTWSLSTKIDQLTALVKDREINEADVEEFSETKLDDNIFNLTDAVAAGNHKQALLLLEGQRMLGEDDGKLFGTILWQFRIMMQIADLLEREENLTSDAIAKKLSIHPFVAKKNLALVKQYSMARLQAIYSELLETDIKTKTGLGDQSLLLDLFVTKV